VRHSLPPVVPQDPYPAVVLQDRDLVLLPPLVGMVQEHDPPYLPAHRRCAVHFAPGLGGNLPQHSIEPVDALRLAVHQGTRSRP